MASYEELKGQADIIRIQAKNEINNILTRKGYMGNEPCTAIDSYYENPTTVWSNKYGDGIVVSIRGGDERNIREVSIDDILIALNAVEKAEIRR